MRVPSYPFIAYSRQEQGGRGRRGDGEASLSYFLPEVLLQIVLLVITAADIRTGSALSKMKLLKPFIINEKAFHSYLKNLYFFKDELGSITLRLLLYS